jgi:hypothetical protein
MIPMIPLPNKVARLHLLKGMWVHALFLIANHARRIPVGTNIRINKSRSHVGHGGFYSGSS